MRPYSGRLACHLQNSHAKVSICNVISGTPINGL
jgi:hypothetical protein